MARVAGVDLTHAYNVPSIVQRDVDPTENDDENLGFAIGDEWLNTESGEFFKCGSALPGKATWGSMVTVPPAKEEEVRDRPSAGGSTNLGDPPKETASGGPATSV